MNTVDFPTTQRVNTNRLKEAFYEAARDNAPCADFVAFIKTEVHPGRKPASYTEESTIALIRVYKEKVVLNKVVVSDYNEPRYFSEAEINVSDIGTLNFYIYTSYGGYINDNIVKRLNNAGIDSGYDAWYMYNPEVNKGCEYYFPFDLEDRSIVNPNRPFSLHEIAEILHDEFNKYTKEVKNRL